MSVIKKERKQKRARQRKFYAKSSFDTYPIFFFFFSWQLAAKLKAGGNRGAFDVHQNKIKVHGTNANVTHTINDDERTEFTRHINGVLAGDAHIGKRLPIPTNTMQIFDECKGIL